MPVYKHIPTSYYKCSDGTFSDHAGPRACTWHGGLLNREPVEMCAPGTTQQGRADVFLVPISDINIRHEWFQNRATPYSIRSVENIVQAVEAGNFRWANMDPVTLWKSPEDGKLYMLSGHSRLEAFSRLCKAGATVDGRDFCKIPAKVAADITLHEARDIALESNTLSTKETDLERSGYYRRLRLEGRKAAEIRDMATRMEGRNANKILAFSYLNSSGRTMNALTSLADADLTSRGNMENIARWIGNARMAIPALSDRHEDELYDWLVTQRGYGTSKGQISNEREFRSRLESIINKRTTFGVLEDSLNIQSAVTKSPVEAQYDEQLTAARQKIQDLDAALREKITSLTRGGATDTQIQELTAGLQASLARARAEYTRLMQAKTAVQEAARAELSLFAGIGAILSAIGRVVSEKPPGITPCVDQRFSTNPPGRGVCSYHGGMMFKKKPQKSQGQQLLETVRPTQQAASTIIFATTPNSVDAATAARTLKQSNPRIIAPYEFVVYEPGTAKIFHEVTGGHLADIDLLTGAVVPMKPTAGKAVELFADAVRAEQIRLDKSIEDSKLKKVKDLIAPAASVRVGEIVVFNKDIGEFPKGWVAKVVKILEDGDVRVETGRGGFMSETAYRNIPPELVQPVRQTVFSSPLSGIESDVPYQSAYNAHRNTSHTPEERALQEINGYVEKMKYAWSKAIERKKEDEFPKFREGYKKRFLDYIGAKSRIVSVLVVGPSNFPTRRNEKANNALDKRYSELIRFEENAPIFKDPPIPVLRTGEEGTIDALKAKLAKLERTQEIMKEANKIIRSGKDVTSRLMEIGLKESTALELQKPDYMGNVGFASYSLTNNNANIKRLRDRIIVEERESQKRAGGDKETSFDSGRIVQNVADNRLQIFFDSIPLVETRTKLKRSGFKWSPKNKAWQRQLTDNARRETEQLFNVSLAGMIRSVNRIS